MTVTNCLQYCKMMTTETTDNDNNDDHNNNNNNKIFIQYSLKRPMYSASLKKN